VSTDGGTVWEQKDSYYDDGGSCIVHPDSANLIYTGGKGPLTQTNWSFVVSRSRDNGTTWTRCVVSGTSAGFCHALAVAPSQTSIVYAGGEVTGAGAVYRSADYGASWARTSGSPGDTVFGLAVHPEDASRVLAATHSGVYLTTNAGTSWTRLSGTSDSRAVALHPAGPDTIVAAGPSGVVVSRNAGAIWTPMNTGLEGQSVSCLSFADRGGACLIAGTLGSSCYAWQFATGLEELRSSNRGTRVAVWPNPFVSYAQASGRERDVFIVYDYSGRVVEQCRGARIGASLAAGVYFVRAGTSGDMLRIVKTR
jgi:photosystem II stability/assembly factor-like uncharacterized protein